MDDPLHELFVRFVISFLYRCYKNWKIDAQTVSHLILLNKIKEMTIGSQS
jgi:hypothetical protein